MNSEEQTILNEKNLNEIKKINENDIKEETKELDNCKLDENYQNDHKLTEDIKTDIINQYNLRITKLELELKQTQFELRDSKLRAQAEIENIRRRSEIDLEKAHKFSLEKFANELLPVIDNLERAVEIVNVNNDLKTQDLQISAILEGINLTLKSLLNTVKKFGIEVISETNIPFNPEIHQAMTIIDSQEIPPNNIIMVMQRGYTLNGRLLRPAMVTVSKSKN